MLNLALVDTQSYAAACNTLFHTVTLRMAKLRADIERWKDLLRRNSAITMVRHLRVDGGPDRSLRSLTFRPSKEEGTSTDFIPLADFLNILPALTKFTWACAPQLPEDVFETLHHRSPFCQIHMESFRLYSVFDASTQEYEERLVSSASLYAIRCSLLSDQGSIILRILGTAHGQRLRTLALTPIVGSIGSDFYLNNVTSKPRELSATLSHCTLWKICLSQFPAHAATNLRSLSIAVWAPCLVCNM